MSKGAKRLAFLTVIAVIVFTVISFRMLIPRNAVFWISVSFMVLAVLLMIFVIIAESDKGPGARSRFYGYPIVRVAAVYLVLQLLVSVFFMLGSKYFPVWPVVVSSLVFFSITAVGVVAAESVDQGQ